MRKHITRIHKTCHDNKKHLFASLSAATLVVHYVAPGLEAIAIAVVGVICVEF